MAQYYTKVTFMFTIKHLIYSTEYKSDGSVLHKSEDKANVGTAGPN